jgi:hypothetical protein
MTREDFNKIMRTTPGCVGALIGTALIAALALLAVYNFYAFAIVGLILIIITLCWWLGRLVYKGIQGIKG